MLQRVPYGNFLCLWPVKLEAQPETTGIFQRQVTRCSLLRVRVTDTHEICETAEVTVNLVPLAEDVHSPQIELPVAVQRIRRNVNESTHVNSDVNCGFWNPAQDMTGYTALVKNFRS